MRLTHLGHAFLLVETDGARLLLAPGVLSASGHVRAAVCQWPCLERLSVRPV